MVHSLRRKIVQADEKPFSRFRTVKKQVDDVRMLTAVAASSAARAGPKSSFYSQNLMALSKKEAYEFAGILRKARAKKISQKEEAALLEDFERRRKHRSRH